MRAASPFLVQQPDPNTARESPDREPDRRVKERLTRRSAASPQGRCAVPTLQRSSWLDRSPAGLAQPIRGLASFETNPRLAE